MKKRWILPVCLIAVGLLIGVICCFRAFSCISEKEAARIGTDYLRAEKLAAGDSNLEVKNSLLTCDLIGLVFGSQKWIICLAEEDGYGNWVFVDAHTGNVTDTQQGFQELFSPITIPKVSNFTSYLSVICYLFMIVFSFLFWKKARFKTLFWISLGLFFTFLILYKIIAVIFLFSLLCFE